MHLTSALLLNLTHDSQSFERMRGEGWRCRVALEIFGHLLLLMSFQLSPRVRTSRACFAPYLCFKSGEIVGRWWQQGELAVSVPCHERRLHGGAVTGSDDFRVCFYDFSRTSKPLVAKLPVQPLLHPPTTVGCRDGLTRLPPQGHEAPVVDVCWNCGGSMLASADADGRVIVWKKNECV